MIVFVPQDIALVDQGGVAVTEPGWFDALERHQFVTLITRRKSGEVVPTTVWFAVHDGAVYVSTDRRSWKVKRIRNDPRVTLRPCSVRGTPRGEPIEAVAQIVPRADLARREAILAARYGWQWKLFALLHRERMAHSELIEIRPPGGTESRREQALARARARAARTGAADARTA